MQVSSFALTTKRYNSIDFVKGFCIIFNIIAHCGWSESEKLQLLFPFWLDMAVPIFMIISGFVYSKSLIKHKNDTVGKAYSFNAISDKIIRFTVPFAIIFLVEQIIFLLHHHDLNILNLGWTFLSGGIGPGSYYTPIMMQFIFWFPVIFFIIRKYDYKGFALCFIINFAYEVLQHAYHMNLDCYRLLIFRYTMLIAFGCYMAIGKKAINKWLSLIGMIVGIIYIIVFKYMGVTPLFTVYWTGTSFWAGLFIIPIAYLLIRSRIHFAPLELLGKASYNIFLVQMVYFVFLDTVSFIQVSNRVLQMIINIVICCVIGVAFY